MSEKTLRMVNLKHAQQTSIKGAGHSVNTIFEEMSNANPPSAEDYGLTDIDKIKRLNAALEALSKINHEFFTWLESDARHVMQFAEDPVSVLKQVCPDFEIELIYDLKNVLTE